MRQSRTSGSEGGPGGKPPGPTRHTNPDLDDDYLTIPVGAGAVRVNETITELGVVVNYFFYDHGNKVSADATWVRDNSAVSSGSAGYLVSPSRGVVAEDGILLRLQWQISF